VAPTPYPLPDTILGFWGGNSSPSREFDQSVYARPLTAVGTPPTASTPAPPEGDRWLLAGSDPSNLWHAPIAAVPTGALVCVFALKLRYSASGQNQSNIFRIAGSNFTVLRFDVVPDGGGKIRVVFSDSDTNTRVIDPVHGMADGETYELRIVSTADGCFLLKDGVQLGSSVYQAFLGTILAFTIGDENFPNPYHIDPFMLSSDPGEPFPVPAYPPPVDGLSGQAT
jgi:hypothetical protein